MFTNNSWCWESTDSSNKQWTDKRQYQLFPSQWADGLTKVLEYGAKKYTPWGWFDEPVNKSLLLAAAERHIYAFRRGKEYDYESGIHHLLHACINLMFVYTHDGMPKYAFDELRKEIISQSNQDEAVEYEEGTLGRYVQDTIKEMAALKRAQNGGCESGPSGKRKRSINNE